MKPRKYTPSKRVRNHIAKWEASDFAGQNTAFGGDAVGAKAVELMNMLGDKANAFTDDELDGLLSTYYNLSPKGFKKTLMPYIDAYAADLSDVNKRGLDLAMRDRWRLAAKKHQKGIRRRANADADLMGLSYQDPIVEQPDVIKRTNIVVPEENTEPTWKGAEDVSPYVTGKPIIKLQPRLKLPPIEELMEDSEWEPGFSGLKNGKLPRYEDGKPPITTGGAGYIPDADLHSAVKNAAYKYLFGDLPIDTIRKRLYDGVRPVGYINVTKRIKEAMSGKKYSDDTYYWQNRDPIWAEYLLIPENQRHDSYFGKLQLSKFRPTIGDDPSAVYYVYPGMISSKADDLIKSANRAVVRRGSKDHYTYQLDNNEYLKFGQSKVADTLSDAFGAHTISRNVDPNKGEYISYYDLWDLAPFKGHGSDESMGIGKPVHFYDRLYLDDFYGVDSSVRGYPKGTYYGGWLPEVTIRPRKQ